MAILTSSYYTDIIRTFYDSISSSTKQYYVFVGKPDSWPNDNSPPSANNSLQSYEQQIYHDMCYGKIITPSNIAYMIPRVDWVANTIFAQYDQNDSSMSNKQYYVMTNKREVYKCIFNNYGSLSTIKPNLSSTYGNFSTSDRYIWKYMYTIDSSYNTTFTSNTFIPITANTYVSSNAVPGTIDYVYVSAGGTNYQTYAEGYISSFVNNYVVRLDNLASPFNNFYTKSAIYLKSGFGAGQIRNINNYNGFTKQVTVDIPFNTFQHLELSNINNGSNITVGQTVTQRIDYVSINYLDGYFNVGDIILQSNSGAGAQILAANSTLLRVITTSSNNFALNYPLYNTAYSGNAAAGTVSITKGNTWVTSVSGTNFVSNYNIGDYIRAGTNLSRNIGRVLTVNSTVVTTSMAMDDTISGLGHYNMPVAATPTSITISTASGIITDTNLSAIKIGISNSNVAGLNYIVGEAVYVVDGNGIDQAANAIVSYANSSYLVLSNVLGIFNPNNYVIGLSSSQNSYINIVTSNPNITIGTPTGSLKVGQSIIIRPTANLSQSIANATLISSYYLPNELTQYIIAPALTITGDGQGAIAYPVINSYSNSISSVVMISSGNGYSYANVSISANNSYGNGAQFTLGISPVNGHGYDAIKELSCRHIGIATTFDTLVSESFKFPAYGSYRKFGIIENPLYDSIVVNLNNFDRTKLHIANTNGFLFSVGEVALQNSTNSAGIVVYSNTSFVEVKNTTGTFSTNGSIYGLQSNALANVSSTSITRFSIGSNVEFISELTSGATAVISQVISNTSLQLTDVSGSFVVNNKIVDYSSNTYANVVSIYVSNNSTDASLLFGKRFSQLGRISFSSTFGSFSNNETIIQNTTLAQAKVLSTSKDMDFSITTNSGTINFGDLVTNVTVNGSGYVLFANTTYVKITAASGKFSPGDILNTLTSNVSITTVYPALTIYDVSGPNKFQTGNFSIIGQTSGASGLSKIANTISYPDLVRNSGSVVYLENTIPFTVSNTSKEQVSLIIKF
jgi:hypothetical protein